MACSLGVVIGAMTGIGGAFGDVSIDVVAEHVRTAAHDLRAGS